MSSDKMAALIVLFAAVCVASAAPPSPPRLYQPPAQAQLQQINSLDYYLDSPEVQAYYASQPQKPGNLAASSNHPARLETLEPDSEVELIPGAQAPQQPPQQNPVSPNLPGLVPGQRVFIVHMPIPGYRPGTIGGYQPVYIVAAGAQGNAGYPGNVPGYQNVNPGYQNVNPGYQSTVYLDPATGQVVSPVAYPRGLLLGTPLLNRPYDLLYQDPNAAYQPGPAPVLGADGNRGAVRLSQNVGLHQGRPGHEAASVETKTQSITESKEAAEEPRRRPNTHALMRNKA